uniref:RING-type domain-containing protein n=1 Tax=Pristionchus pacificus TaxID=54126 RepID=A0A8R1Y5H9_PRIPA
MNPLPIAVERGCSSSKLIPLRLSKKTKFGALSKRDFNSMVSMWRCVNCHFFPRQIEEKGAEKTLFVLKCGHFICKRCREERRKKRSDFNCQLHLLPNGNEICDTITDLAYPIPVAMHVIEMRWMLSERGFPCHVCRSEAHQPNFFSRDLIHVCSECTILQENGKWTSGRKIFEDPRRINDFEVINFDSLQCDKVIQYNYALLCVYCARVPSNIHGSHLILPFDQHAIRSQITVLYDEDKSISHRSIWSMTMVSKEMGDRLLAGYLTCHCGFEYSSKKGDIKPVMLGCNHIVCSACAQPNLMDRLFNAIPRCPICLEKISWKSDKLHDLDFASSRVISEYTQCEVCNKFFPEDRIRICSKQFREKATDLILECPNNICFDCIRSPASKKHHMQMNYRGILRK